MPSFEQAHHLDGFPTPDGRFRFKPDWASLGADHARMPRLPDHMAVTDEVTPERPYRLVAAPSRQFLNTSFTEMPTSRRTRGAADRAPASGRPWRSSVSPTAIVVRLGNHRGSVALHIKGRQGQHRSDHCRREHLAQRYWLEGIGINCLIGADAAPPDGGAAFHDTAVWLEPVTGVARRADAGDVEPLRRVS